MTYLGDLAVGVTTDFKFTTRRFSTGAPFALASGAISVYKDNSTTQSTSGVTLTADFDSLTGVNHVRIDTSSDGTFYSAGSNFQVLITTGTVDSVSVVGETIAHFSIAHRPVQALAANVITATAIASDAITAAKVASDVGTEIGTAVWATTTRQLTSAQTFDLTGNITGNLSGSVGSVTGNVGGNVTGSVGSVSGLTASDVAAIKAKTDSLTFTQAGNVDANIQYVNDVLVTGTGALGNEWGP